MAEVWRVEYGEGELSYEDVLVPDGCSATVENRVFRVVRDVEPRGVLAEIRLVVSAIRGDLLLTAGVDPVAKGPGKVGKLFGRGKP